MCTVAVVILRVSSSGMYRFSSNNTSANKVDFFLNMLSFFHFDCHKLLVLFIKLLCVWYCYYTVSVIRYVNIYM